MREIGKVDANLKCIPNNMEKYVSFSLRRLRFIDSFQFLSSSLSKLVSNKNPEDFKIMKQFEPDEERRKLMLRKGVYPYEYMDSFERFSETSLPPKEAFYSTLTRSHITDKDYEHAKKVWEAYGCETLGDFHDIYLATDILLLVDVFESFREMRMEKYGLDPAHYYTTPGFAWDALLKMTNKELELFTDYDMHIYIDKGMRGGISTVDDRYAKANNPYLKDYDPEKDTSYVMYLDETNEYGWAMSQYLPTGNFRWLEKMPTEKEIMSWREKRKTGFIFDVDMEYPEELHEKHNGYPLAPEKTKVPHAWHSKYQKGLAKDLNLTKDNTEKLLLTLRGKKNYVLHYRNLQLYLKLGMKLTKVHRVLAFDQEPWMKPYIRFNTEERQMAKAKFKQEFFKLMNNAVFGKTMENLRNRVNVELVRGNEYKNMRKLLSDPPFDRWRALGENIFGIQMHKDHILFNRPIYIGMCALDLSKILLYDYYYSYLKPKYRENCELLYTDTDSLLLLIKTDDIYKDMAENLDYYDTSGYPEDHPLFSLKNMKVPGKLKDECNGALISEVVCLRSKMYSILQDNDKNTKKAKGTVKCVVEKLITHQNYKDALFKKIAFKHGMDMLRSKDHQIFGIHLNKTSLSLFDSKRWIEADGVGTKAYGHKDIARK